MSTEGNLTVWDLEELTYTETINGIITMENFASITD